MQVTYITTAQLLGPVAITGFIYNQEREKVTYRPFS